MSSFSNDIPPIDLIALAWLLLCWWGYTAFADSQWARRRSVSTRMDEYRLVWMRRMLERDNHMTDVQVVQTIMASVTFLAQTSLFAVAGAFAIIGAREQARAVLAELPFAHVSTPAAFDVKAMTLAAIFVHAFFKCTWAHRQLTYVTIVVGAAPSSVADDGAKRHAERAARVASSAARHVNRALRGFYFGLGALSWFLHPWLFIGVTAWVLLVLWRREFYSQLKRELGAVGDPID